MEVRYGREEDRESFFGQREHDFYGREKREETLLASKWEPPRNAIAPVEPDKGTTNIGLMPQGASIGSSQDELRANLPRQSEKDIPCPYRVKAPIMSKEEFRTMVQSPSYGLGHKVSEEDLSELYDRYVANEKSAIEDMDAQDNLLKYARLLREIRRAFGDWFSRGMPVDPGSRLERYLKSIGKLSKLQNKMPAALSDLDAGRNVVAAAWIILRDPIGRAIEVAESGTVMTFDLDFLDAYGVNIPGIPGYTIDRKHVLQEDPMKVLDTMIHEPLHDFGQYFIGHTAFGSWERLGRGAGWSETTEDWGAGVKTALGYLAEVLSNMPPEPGGTGGCSSLLESLYRKAGIRSVTSR